MFDIGAAELLLVVMVAVLVIGPKDMPRALRTAGRWIGKMRKLSGHFRAGVDAMVRDAELEDMENKWKAQNERIMREHPADAPREMEPTGAYPSRPAKPSSHSAEDDAEQEGVTAEARKAVPRDPLEEKPVKPSEEPELPLGPKGEG